MPIAGAEIRGRTKEEALAALRDEGGPLFGVLDAARDGGVRGLLRASGEEHRSLYDGRRGEHLAAVAPHLVRLPAGSPLLGALIDRGWGKSAGIYLSCDRPFDEVRRHLRRFLVVETEEGEAFYFRFYDPRVLRGYLPSCTPEEIGWLFGPARAIWLEGRPAGALIRVPRPEPGRAPMPRGLPVIRDAQREALAREHAEVFVERMAERLEADLAAGGAGPAGGDLREAVRAGIARAEGYGIFREREQERFVELMGRLGPSFDRSVPWAEEILRRGDLDARVKMKRIARRLAEGR
jgi:hypothetical protein